MIFSHACGVFSKASGNLLYWEARQLQVGVTHPLWQDEHFAGFGVSPSK